MNMDEWLFYLWAFQIGDQIVVTRGRDQDEAYRGIERNIPRGVTVAFLSELPIDAAIRYGENHDEGWLQRAPKWLENELIH